ncbi:T-cell surface antigen CD2-like isoform X2 [Thalassophryne amazonica]|uniref:T-cell surface antigen CD2-like isoform X2 n=1 Tax=Thalassophryne amazonica TaxID=390379 RepID=UPI0014711427|nr:T-cell surface antigen CD2-like isoform X2 [Thalassophryne amazonica]
MTMIVESGGYSFLQNMREVVMKMVMMKMAAVSMITLLLICCSGVSSTGSKDGCDNSIVRGGDFTVVQTHPLQDNDDLRWFHNNTRIFRRKGTNCYEFCSVKVDQKGSLILKKVETHHAGRYNSMVYTNGVLQKPHTTTLCVLDRVPKPEVNVECATDSITFMCVSTQDQGVTYQWLQNDKGLKETSQTLKWKNKQATDSFKCKLSNPVSHEISAPVTPNCIKSVFPKTLFGLSFWIMVGILAGGTAVVLVLIIIIIVCCNRAKRKRQMQVKEEEELRLGWTQQHQHHHQHHHHQHQHQHNHPSHHQHQQQPANQTGPRQHRSKRPSDAQCLKVPESQNPKPSPRNTLQRPTPVANDEEHPPPLPQPRKKATRTPRV